MYSSIVIIGQSALSEKTEERARRAEAHFENQLKVSIELGYADDIAHARRNIACAKFNYEGYNNEETLKECQNGKITCSFVGKQFEFSEERK
jgi:hypothetical protein